MGRAADAESWIRGARETRLRLYDADHVMVARSDLSLGGVLADQKKYEQAEPLLRHALGVFKKHFDEPHRDIGAALRGLGSVVLAQGRLEEAEWLLRAAGNMEEKLLPSGHVLRVRSMLELAVCLDLQHKDAEAIEAATRAAEMAAKALPESDPTRVTCEQLQARMKAKAVSLGRLLPPSVTDAGV